MLNPIYGGIAGGKLSVNEFDLGDGALLKSTYAHVMAPFLMAFSPAESGKPHPPPWSAVSGGLAYDIHIELKVDAAGNPKWLMETQALWWITALLRLKASWLLSAPVFSNCSFQEITNNKGVKLFPFELITRRKACDNEKLVELSLDDLAWVAKYWKQAAYLFHRDRNFAQAFQAFDYSTTVETPSLGLLTLWGALEHLFAPAKQELRFRVSALIACYLTKAGEDRIKIHKKLLKLYDERSQAAHTAHETDAELTSETFVIMNSILQKIITENQVPSRESLEKLLFGAD